MLPAYLYKKYITEMLEEINDEKQLEKIYRFVHHRFIWRNLDNNKEVQNECRS